MGLKASTPTEDSKTGRFRQFWQSSQPLQSIRDVTQSLLDQPCHGLVLRLTLVLLLLYGSSNLILDAPLRIVCGLMLISPGLITHQGMWVLVCGLVWWVNAANWLWIDNHQFLISYWCLACALAVSAKNTDAVLAWNGRILVGLVFCFATLWKLLSGEYLNGSFLHYTFLTDDRIQAFATFIGRLSPDVLPQNRLLEVVLKTTPDACLEITLGTSPGLERFALVFSYWTLLIEGAVAAAFLLIGIHWLARLRNWILILFVATTYFLLPVLGFAYVLIIMGLAQCPPKRSGDRIAYLSLLAGLQLARLPWETFF